MAFKAIFKSVMYSVGKLWYLSESDISQKIWPIILCGFLFASCLLYHFSLSLDLLFFSSALTIKTVQGPLRLYSLVEKKKTQIHVIITKL